MKLLIDECLSLELVHMARENAAMAKARMSSGSDTRAIKDWNLLKVALDAIGFL
jgi:hypothetical protein